MSLSVRNTPATGLLLVLIFLVVPAPRAVTHAQSPMTPAAISGSVHDPNGRPIANATVNVRDGASSDVRATTTTDADGHFRVTSLPTGTYTVEVAMAGFVTGRQAGVDVSPATAQDISLTLALSRVSEEVNVLGDAPAVVKDAPSHSSLTARSAQSEITKEFVDNDISPVSDFSQVIQMAPGTFSVSPNGVGLGDTKTYFRGFADGQYSMTFDGIPFNDTNDPTHHSWAFFPSQFIGGTVFDRSPGSASSIGPSTYGGSVNLLSRDFLDDQHFRGTGSYGSYSTRLVDFGYDSGTFGPGGKSQVLMDLHQMKSDGYETFNDQKRDGFSAKYKYAFSDQTALTVFSGVLDLWSNTPNTKGPTRAQVQQFGDNYLLSGDASQANYFGYNFYHVPTDFEYVGLKSNLGHGWSIDDKVYTLRYYNKQNYNGTTITTTSATDKLNSYRKYGNLVPLSQVSSLGVFRTGLWSEYAMTNRYQTPSDPRTWIDAPLPNFHEKFNTTTLQPYAEYELAVTSKLRVTPGVKLAYYRQDFTQFADNGKIVGSLGGAPSVTHVAAYRSWLPSLDAHYLLKGNWSAYAQYGWGNNIPPTSVFDVANAAVSVLPKPTLTKTYQVGTVWQSSRMTLDLDSYYIHFDNAYSSSPDPVTGEPVYFFSGASLTKGVEAESNVLFGGGLSLYLNGTAGSAKYTQTGLWVQNAPKDTETVGVTYRQGSWDVALFDKRVGGMYNDNGSVNQAVAIAPFSIVNLFANYTLRRTGYLGDSRLRLSVNNLFDNRSITGVTPASTKTSIESPGDILTLLPSRSVSLTFTVDVGRSSKTP